MRSRIKRPRSKLLSVHHGMAKVLGDDKFEVLANIAQLRRLWPEIVGSMMAARTEPISIEKDGDINCLWVAVDHPVMSQQIRFLRDDIRKACFKRCKIQSLGKIRTRVLPNIGTKVELAAMPPAKLSLSEKKHIASKLKSIKDSPLRHAIFQAQVAQLAYQQSSQESS